MTLTTQNHFIILKRLGISLGVVATIIALFGLLGHFWLPGYAKSQLEIILSETLDRPVTIQSIDIQPYTLEITVHGFRVGEKIADTPEVFFSFDRLYVDLSAESVTRRAPVVTALTLATPTIRLVREAENQFNISDLVEKFTQPADDETVDSSQGALFSISNIAIENGHIEFVDQHRHSHQEISEINFGIPFVANFESVKENWLEPHFNARINGAPLSLDGKLRPFTDKREATLELKLANIDLTHIKKYLPLPTGISLLSGHFNSELQLTFAQISDESPIISLTGNTVLQQIKITNQAVQAPYHATLKKLHTELIAVDLMGKEPFQFAMHLNNIALSREDEDESALSLVKLTVDDIMINTAEQKVAVGEITLDRLNVTMQREENGNIDLSRLFAALSDRVLVPIPGRKPLESEANEVVVDNKTAAPADAIIATKEASTGDSSWSTQIKRIKLKAARLRYEDITLAKASPMVIDPLDFSVENIDLSGATPLDLTLVAQVNQHGHIKTNGSLAWAPLAIDLNLDLEAVDLVSLQGWADNELNALLTNGDISFQGNIKAGGAPLKLAVNGQGQLANFNVFDQKNASNLLRWKTLDINDINFVNEPLRVDISTIKLSDFFARAIISPEGNLNLKQIVRRDETATPSESTETIPDSSETDKAMPVHIGKIVLQQGNIDFNDLFINPNYRANLTGLSGQIGPLRANESGKIDIRGALDKIAPLEIQGNLDPFSTELRLDIVAKVKDINLPPFSPYSGKYIGYAIEKGKLSVDVNYHIENGKLTADNKVFLDQFTLGEQVESEDALSVPLKLAISLLKNRRGEIDIHLPIKGSLNDPQFSLGDVIFDAFINLITKAITAPFSLLAASLSGGEELSSIEFAPGYAKIEGEAEKILQTLSGALIDRPALELEIAGYTDAAVDPEGLKLAILKRKVKAQKLEAEAENGEAVESPDDIALTTEEYSEYLTLAYEKEAFEKPTNIIGLTKSLPDLEMEQLILSHIEAGDNEMRELARRRALAAQNWLINQGGIAGERIFVLGTESAPEMDDKTPGSRVEFTLK